MWIFGFYIRGDTIKSVKDVVRQGIFIKFISILPRLQCVISLLQWIMRSSTIFLCLDITKQHYNKVGKLIKLGQNSKYPSFTLQDDLLIPCTDNLDYKIFTMDKCLWKEKRSEITKRNKLKYNTGSSMLLQMLEWMFPIKFVFLLIDRAGQLHSSHTLLPEVWCPRKTMTWGKGDIFCRWGTLRRNR
jgi:hypothetical protein